MAKQVTDRQGAATQVTSFAETNAARLQQRFAERYSAFLAPGETLPDLALLTALLGRRLRTVNDDLTQTSDAYDRELADDVAPRESRDENAAALTAMIIDMRDILEAAYGPRIVLEMGLDGRTDTEPKAILAKAKRFVLALNEPERIFPKPRRKGVKVDMKSWSADLTSLIEKLEKALEDVAREAREAQTASEAKSTAMDVNDQVFSRSASVLVELFRLVEDDALASRIRPSRRKAGQLEANDEEPQDAPAAPTP